LGDNSPRKIVLRDEGEVLQLLGENDQNIRLIEDTFPAKIIARGNELTIDGDAGEAGIVEDLLTGILEVLRRGDPVPLSEIKYAIKMIKKDRNVDLSSVFSHRIYVSPKNGGIIRPKTIGQKRYVEAMENFDMVFCIGPAGTGKTYLAVAMAVAALKNKEVDRIILTRPALEAGERLGFLPGDIYDKIAPYLRPLYDALFDIMKESSEALIAKGIIEIVPLAYMRGRTLNRSFIILDEAQNTTIEQMKMFLTRLGFNSKVVITGDVTQVDLPSDRPSGLIQIQSILSGIDGIKFIHLEKSDIVRHPLVQKIIKAYEDYEEKSKGR
jgi:phosphate starvation-inducible PhoH-like protein